MPRVQRIMEVFSNPRRCLVPIEGDAVLGGDNIVGALEERKDCLIFANLLHRLSPSLRSLLPTSCYEMDVDASVRVGGKQVPGVGARTTC